MGVVARIDPIILSIERNTSLGSFDSNGVAVALKQVNPARVLGYVAPAPAAQVTST